MRKNIRLDTKGLAEVMRSSEVVAEVRKLAESVADAASGDSAVLRHEVPVTVEEYTAQGGRLRSPRPAFAVTMKHPGGLGIEAKHGTLSRAAESRGLRVKGGGA